MKKNTFSGIILTLLLVCMSTLAFNIHPLNAGLQTAENQNEKGNNEQAKIVEHKISTSELEELISKFGVWEEGRNYNKIIDGHGTGLSPPTEEKWAEIADGSYVVDKILIDQPPPSSVDHTTKPWFPPIGDQDGEGSCTAFAVGYYTKTFQEAKEHGWNLSEAEWVGGYYGHPTPEYQDRIFSPDFIYHLVNRGGDHGSNFYDAIRLVCEIGASSWEKMPYDPYDSTSWPSEDAWREAPLYRGNSSGCQYIQFNTDDDIVSLKNWIASDHLAIIAVDANKYIFLTSGDFWTLDNYFVSELNHMNTIVGYDDSISYTEKGELRYGAFKIANSWGVGFTGENIPDGYYWISYEAMKQRVEECVFYQDRIGYDPKLLASFEIDHSEREEFNILIGMGDHGDPLATKSFSNLTDGGSKHDYPFCPNGIVLDVTEFEDAVPSVLKQSFFMLARAGTPSPHSGMYEWHPYRALDSWFWLGQENLDIPETGATLRFWNYYKIEEYWDYGYVEVYDVDTDEWYTLPGINTVNTAPNDYNNPDCPAGFEPSDYYDAGRWNAFTGSSGYMYEEEMDLTPFAGHTIELYFTYWTDYLILESGWYIDDIEIPEIDFFDDVESGANGWIYDGWYIATNGTLLSFSIESYHNYTAESLKAQATSSEVPLTITNQDVFADLIFGDTNSDGSVDFQDLTEIDEAFGSASTSTNWNPECDFNKDDIISILDLVILGKNYGKSI